MRGGVKSSARWALAVGPRTAAARRQGSPIWEGRHVGGAARFGYMHVTRRSDPGDPRLGAETAPMTPTPRPGGIFSSQTRSCAHTRSVSSSPCLSPPPLSAATATLPARVHHGRPQQVHPHLAPPRPRRLLLLRRAYRRSVPASPDIPSAASLTTALPAIQVMPSDRLH